MGLKKEKIERTLVHELEILEECCIVIGCEEKNEALANYYCIMI